MDQNDRIRQLEKYNKQLQERLSFIINTILGYEHQSRIRHSLQLPVNLNEVDINQDWTVHELERIPKRDLIELKEKAECFDYITKLIKGQ